MRIALLLSGHYRSFDSTLTSLQKHILAVNPNIDVFLSTYYEIDHCNCQKISINDAIKLIDKIVESLDTFPHSQIMVERNTEFLRNMQAVLSMFYKIKSCNDLKIKYEQDNNFKYDIVVRSRPDLLFKHDIKFEPSQGITTSAYGNFAGVNDQFAYGNSIDMDVYCNMYDNITSVLENYNIHFSPELMLARYLEMNNMQVNKIDIDYDIVRLNGGTLNNKQRENALLY